MKNFGQFDYPISLKYVTSWNITHALRELIANALDAEAQYGARKEILYNAGRKKLRIVNHGVTLDRTALLLGGTDKEGQINLIGQYGEGLKLAMLVLLRNKLQIRIRNGREEDWIPSIRPSEKWGAEVLSVEIRKAGRQVENFEVVVEGLEPETWNEMKDHFLFMNPAKWLDFETGQLLTDLDHKGKIYVRGVFVLNEPGYYYGYNFKDLDIGRDRQAPERWMFEHKINMLHREYVSRNPEHIAILYDLLGTDCGEASAFRSYDYEDLVEAWTQHFVKLHGADAIPCATSGEAQELQFLGIRGVVMQSRLQAEKLQRKLKNPSQIKALRKLHAVKTYALSELTPEEGKIFDQAVRLLILAFDECHYDDLGPIVGRISVVDFQDSSIRGTHLGTDIKIAQKILSDLGMTLMTLIHEFAHDFGLDGSPEHLEKMQTWTIRAINALYQEHQLIGHALVEAKTAHVPRDSDSSTTS